MVARRHGGTLAAFQVRTGGFDFRPLALDSVALRGEFLIFDLPFKVALSLLGFLIFSFQFGDFLCHVRR